MASSSSFVKNLEENFLQCPVCLEQFCNPRSLPCLHRYCSDCLEKLINECQGIVSCPECRTGYAVPADGVKGFKKDFHIQNIIEFIKLQLSLESKQEQLCCGCSGTLNVLAFCFKCNGYLCTECYNFHVTNHMVTDHKSHILSLKDLEESIPLEKLLSLNDVSRCKNHAENISQLCCKTCSNLAICLACTYGEHKNHDIEDVNTFAKSEREKLSQCLSQIDECKVKVENTKQKLGSLKQEIVAHAVRKNELIKCRGEEKICAIEGRIVVLNMEMELEKKDIVKKYNCDVKESKKRMAEELENVRKKWEHTLQVAKNNMTEQVQSMHHSRQKSISPLEAEVGYIKKDMAQVEKSVNTFKLNNLERADELSQHSENTLTRCKNLEATAKSILASKSNWTAAKAVGGICTATGSLLQDMAKELPDTESLLCYKDNELMLTQMFDVKLPDLGWVSRSMTITGNGIIVVSGSQSNFRTSGFIRFTQNGTVLKSNYFDHDTCDRVCAGFKKFRVVSVCPPDEVSMFDIRNDTYFTKKLGKYKCWKHGLNVECVATDDANNRIIVGCRNSRDMYVLDENLNFLKLFTLPDIIRWPWEIAVSGDKLFVCDDDGKRAFSVNRVGKLLYEFKKPDSHIRIPCSVCADHNGHAFIIWVHDDFLGANEYDILAMYSGQTGRMLATKKVAEGSIGIKTVNDNGECKLYLSAEDTRGSIKVFTYDIV